MHRIVINYYLSEHRPTRPAKPRSGMKSSDQGEVDADQDLSNSSTTPKPSANIFSHSKYPPESDKTTAGKDEDTPVTLAASSAMIHIQLPVFINWLGIVGLIFGGCCSNVSHNHRQLFGSIDLT